MNEWLIAATVLFVALIGCGAVCAFSRPLHALIALELGGSVAAALLIVMAEGYHRQPFAYLGIVLAVLTFAGSLSFVRLLERRV